MHLSRIFQRIKHSPNGVDLPLLGGIVELFRSPFYTFTPFLSRLEQHVVEWWPSFSAMVVVFGGLLMVQFMSTVLLLPRIRVVSLAPNYVSMFLTILNWVL